MLMILKDRPTTVKLLKFIQKHKHNHLRLGKGLSEYGTEQINFENLASILLNTDRPYLVKLEEQEETDLISVRISIALENQKEVLPTHIWNEETKKIEKINELNLNEFKDKDTKAYEDIECRDYIMLQVNEKENKKYYENFFYVGNNRWKRNGNHEITKDVVIAWLNRLVKNQYKEVQ